MLLEAKLTSRLVSPSFRITNVINWLGHGKKGLVRNKGQRQPGPDVCGDAVLPRGTKYTMGPTRWSIALIVKLIVAELVKKFLIFNGIGSLTAMFEPADGSNRLKPKLV
jgi:hypothetical protein